MKRDIILKLTILVSIIFVLLEHDFCFGGQSILKSGCARANITPPVGIWLSGWGSREKPSECISDELYVKSLVLFDGKNKVAIVSADLLWVSAEMTSAIRNIIEEKTGIPKGNILISASHTHFGPLLRRYKQNPFARTEKPPEFNLSYIKVLEEKIAGTVSIANKNLIDVKIGSAIGEAGELVYNRRTKRNDNKVVMTFTLPPSEQNLTFGPIDPEVGNIRVEDTEGKLITSLINFACHPVSGGGSSKGAKEWFYCISADYPAYAEQVVEKIEGGMCMFTLGTAGDIVPIKRGVKPRFQIGYALGGEALRRLQLIPTIDNLSLKSVQKFIRLPVKEKPPEDPIIEIEPNKKEITTEIQAIAIGNNIFVGLPGEVLVEIGLKIKKEANHKNLFLISLSNDSVGYICHSEAYDEGGYEPTRGTNLAKGAGEIIVKEAVNIINQIK